MKIDSPGLPRFRVAAVVGGAILALGATATAPGGQAGGAGGAIPTAGVVEDDARSGEPMGPVEILEVESVGSPTLSPDGGSVLFTRSRADWERDARITRIWRVDIDGTGLRQMTNGPESESSPAWDPDGGRFAFLTRRGGEDAETQVWLMAADGGEAWQLTDHPTAVSSIGWAPDGDAVYFLAEEERTEEEMEREERSGEAVLFPRNWKHRHLWRVPVPDPMPASGGPAANGDADLPAKGWREPVDAERVTAGEWSVWDYAISRDGGAVTFVRGPTPLLDDLSALDLYLRELGSGATRRLTDNDGVPESSPELSPDGRWVAFTAGADEDGGFYYETNLFVVPAAGGAARMVRTGMAGEVERYAWADEPGSLIAQVNLGAHSELFRVEVPVPSLERDAGDGAVAPGGSGASGVGPAGSSAGPPDGGFAAPLEATVTPLTGSREGEPEGSVEGFDHEPHRGLVFERGAPDNPGDLWYAVADPFDARRVTDLHRGMRRRYALPGAEVVTWSSSDGTEVEGILWHPNDEGEGAGNGHPLVVQIHGGPASSAQVTFSGSWGRYVPVLTARGYMVLQPNYRGGVGYGDEFLRDMVGAYFNHADDDVYTGVDHLVAEGLVDPERTAIMGWSAGGHMTNWVVTQTDRFAAASSGAGAANWTSMYAQSDVRIYRTPWFGGTPWQEEAPLRAYLDNSPVFQAHRVTTPTLIFVGEEDDRVPMSQSVEMYRALHHSGVETKLVTFPGQPHGLRRLKHQLHKINVELEWFERHVRDRGYEYAVPPGSEAEESSEPG